jgi:Leucine-rich repeat (LRR) protein
MVTVRENTEYDTDIHPEVTEIHFERHIVGNFFKDDRFPNLVHLVCCNNQLTKLKLNCSSLRTLWCVNNKLTTLKLMCPSLQTLWCNNNKLTTLELNCPSLRTLWCYNNQLTNLNGLEFCEKLITLRCSERLSESVNILKAHLPNITVFYE